MKLLFAPAQSYKTITLLLISLVFCHTASAVEKQVKAFTKGSFEQIKQAHKDKPYVISFWSETCGYCMKELALLGKLQKSSPNISIVSITTDPFLEKHTINRILSQKDLSHVEKWVFSDRHTSPIYYDVDPKWYGELPFTYFFDKNNLMLKHKGTINKKELTKWFIENRNTL